MHAAGTGSVWGFSAEARDAAVYVVDLAGFTQLTEDWVERNARFGAEQASDLVTAVFQRLSEQARKLQLQVGGFGGDSLSLWTELSPSAPPLAEFDAAVDSALSSLRDAPAFRSIRANGPIWTGEAYNGEERVPVIWGHALAAAFSDMKARESRTSSRTAPAQGPQRAMLRKISASRVIDRWSMVVMLLDGEAARLADTDRLSQLWAACCDVARAHRSLCENISQDEKGLFVTIGLDAVTSRDALQSDLSDALRELGVRARIRAARGPVFCDPVSFGDRRFRVFLGAPLNRAAKALADPEQAFEPQASGDVAPRPNEVFGRRREVSGLAERLKAAPSRGARLLEIAGPAGMGKSTILAAALDQAALAQTDILRLNLRPRHAFAPYATLTALGEAAGAPQVEGTDWAAFARTLAAHLPPCVIIDDWHWCDPASAKLFPTLHRTAHGVQFILLYRPQDNPPDSNVAPDMRLSLEGLDETATGQLMAARLGRTPTHQEVEAAMRLCDGNAFWIQEIAGEIAASGSQELVTELSRRTSLDGLLHHRADQLSRSARALWRVLSSWQAPLEPALAQALLAPFGAAADASHYRELTDLGWGQFVDGTRQFALTHQILAEAGRSGLPAGVSRPLNENIARELTRQRADRARIAQHWERAEQPGRAAIAYRQAGESAIALGAHSLGLALLERAQEVVPDDAGTGRSGRLRRRRRQLAYGASAHWGNGQVRRALAALSEMDGLKRIPASVPSVKARNAAQRAEFVRTEAAHFAGRMPDVLAGVWRGGSYSDRRSPNLEARARRNGMMMMMASYARLPVSWRLRGLTARVEDRGDARAETLLRVYHGIVQLRRCQWVSSGRSIELAYNAARKTHDPLLQGVVVALDAALHLLHGDGPRCIEAYRRLGRLAEQQPNQMYQSWSEYGEAQGHLINGAPEIALRLAEQARVTRRGVGDHLSACIIEGALGRAACDLGDFDRAAWHARRALSWGTRLPPSNFTSLEGIAAPAQLAARAAIARGENTPALKELQRRGRRLLWLYSAIFPFAGPRLAYVDGLIAEARGDTAGACRRIGRALAKADALDMAHEAQLARDALCRIGEKTK